VSPAPDVDVTLIEDHRVSNAATRSSRQFRLQFETSVEVKSDVGKLRDLLTAMAADDKPENKAAVYTFVNDHTSSTDLPSDSLARAVIKVALGVK
jgi:hypothetical protein